MHSPQVGVQGARQLRRKMRWPAHEGSRSDDGQAARSWGVSPLIQLILPGRLYLVLLGYAGKGTAKRIRSSGKTHANEIRQACN